MKLLVSSILVLILIAATFATPPTNVSEQLSPEFWRDLQAREKRRRDFIVWGRQKQKAISI